MTKRGLTRRRDGRYRRTVAYETPDGTMKRLNVYGKTQAEVNAKAKEARERAESGAPVRDASRTLTDWIDDWRSTSLQASDRSEATKTLYRGLLARHVVPALGSLPLRQVRPADVERLMLGIGERGLSASTQRNAYAALRACLDDAVKNGLLAANPAGRVRRPRADRLEARSLTTREVHALLEAASTSRRNRPDEEPRYHRAMRLLLLTGLRRGELLALKWSDIDFDRAEARVKGSLTRQSGSLVVGTAKTSGSLRTAVLSHTAVALFRSQHRAQVADRLRAANCWQETGFVFTTEHGQPVDPRNLLRAVSSAAKAADLPPGVGVHTLRHTYATTALIAGVPVHVVSRNLGHSSISITVDTYGHVTDDASRDAAARVAEAFGF